MVCRALKCSTAFNNSIVKKLAEYYTDYCRDEITTWKRITLELLNEHEDQQYNKLSWQDLRNYFKRSLVYHLSQLEIAGNSELVDRLQYPYLRKVYVVTIMLLDHYPANTSNHKINNSIVRDNKLFIKYITNGNYDPLVVDAFKRHGKKGVRVYVPINVEDPIYQLTKDEIQFLFRVEQIRTDYNKRGKERSQVPPTASATAGSPVVLDGVPVQIQNASQSRNCFSVRNLLEEESLTVNTQEYADIIKESLEQELPPLVQSVMNDDTEGSLTFANRSNFSCRNEVVYLDQDEILNATGMLVVNQDPLYLSCQSNNISRRTSSVCGNESVNLSAMLTPCSGNSSRIDMPVSEEDPNQTTPVIKQEEQSSSSDNSPSELQNLQNNVPSESFIAEQRNKGNFIAIRDSSQISVSRNNEENVFQTSIVGVEQSCSTQSHNIIVTSEKADNEQSVPCLERLQQRSSRDYFPDDFFTDDEDAEKDKESNEEQMDNLDNIADEKIVEPLMLKSFSDRTFDSSSEESRTDDSIDSTSSVAGNISMCSLSSPNQSNKSASVDEGYSYNSSISRANNPILQESSSNETQTCREQFTSENSNSEEALETPEPQKHLEDEPITISDDDEESVAPCTKPCQPNSSRDYLPDDFFTDDEESEKDVKRESSNSIAEEKYTNINIDGCHILDCEERNDSNSVSSTCLDVYRIISESSSSSLEESETSSLDENNVGSDERQHCPTRDVGTNRNVEPSSTHTLNQPGAVELNSNDKDVTTDAQTSNAVLEECQSVCSTTTDTVGSTLIALNPHPVHVDGKDVLPDDFFSEDEGGDVNVEGKSKQSDASVSNSSNSFDTVVTRNTPDTTSINQEKPIRDYPSGEIKSDQPKQAPNCGNSSSTVVAETIIDNSVEKSNGVDENIEPYMDTPHSTSELGTQLISDAPSADSIEQLDSNVPIDLSTCKHNNRYISSNQSICWRSTQKLLIPVVQSRLNMYGAMRYRWPELFSRDKPFTNIMELCSTMTTMLFYNLKPDNFQRSNVFIQMINAIASRVAFGIATDGPAQGFNRTVIPSSTDNDQLIPVRKKPRLR
ncbi:uncharacterized protein LOC129779168 isoform X2 [Toxorhynchites rutilus septentrionalis]|uniref:uncharacterized protein LOC129779168 isoform X2 n=1 Tax=Toxorhynchites rutilus septentrionalis TaxID=329112 RepID=UPI002479A312|nr:uncharacterized protein LOC129779168 isoform X2 [Toxorhynchites rutilus septentrionalis]